MTTYGQERYITQAINGVLKQECNFEIELILVNDCSPDNTDLVIQHILETHPKASIINYIKNKKNKGITLNSIFALQQCKGEYIAICEGDDYWINPFKLQKQVNFLDVNNNFMLCHSNVEFINEDGNIIESKLKSWNHVNDHLDYKCAIFMPIAFTCTSVFRNLNFVNKLSKDIVSVDWMLWVLLTLNGDAKFINEKMAAYRVGVGIAVERIWERDYGYWSLFLLKQLSFKIELKKNIFLTKGAIYYFFIYYSRIFNITFFSVIANKFRYKT